MKALIVNGSPRGAKATSNILGTLLADELRAHDAVVDHAWALGALRDASATAAMLDTFDEADLVVLTFPLYVDSLPAPLVRVLELAAARRVSLVSGEEGRCRRLVAVVQCGFPEASQCDTALAICRLFARDAGMEWAGGLAMGEGGMLANGLDKMPPKAAANIRATVASVASALADGRAMPEDAAVRFRSPMIPPRVYTGFANLGWHLQARGNHTTRPLGHRAYAGRE